MTATITDLASRPHALYRFYGAGGTLLYIGITADLPTRFHDHRGDKNWWLGVTNVTVEHYPDRPTVLEAERRAIIAERPLYNSQHNQPTTPKTIHRTPAPSQPKSQCPVCRKSSTYYPSDFVAASRGRDFGDRYFHADGSDNQDCWLAILRGTEGAARPSRTPKGIAAWTFTNRHSQYARTTPLWLSWEVACDPITDDYLPDEITPEDLWRRWLDYHSADEKAEAIFGHGAFEISWFVEGPGTCEGAPLCDTRISTHYMRQHPDAWDDEQSIAECLEERHFLHHFTWPRDPTTGVRLQWSRLPVIDKVWRTKNLPDPHTLKGGFIQEATGWKPAPLQPFVNVYQLGKMAGLWIPERGR